MESEFKITDTDLVITEGGPSGGSNTHLPIFLNAERVEVVFLRGFVAKRVDQITEGKIRREKVQR
jgi:hypothetical protein